METFKFKDEFENKLKGVKREFIKEVYVYCKKSNIEFIPYCEELNSNEDFVEVIYRSFDWIKTNKGFKYWRRFKDKFQ